MQLMATAVEMGRTEGSSRSRAERPQSEPRSEFPQPLRWLYAARPSLTPTVYVPGPVVAARKV
jgi:hypothetical protein